MRSSEKLDTIYVIVIGFIAGAIGGIVPAFHGGLPYLLKEIFDITLGYISHIHIVGAIAINGTSGAFLGALGAWLGIYRLLKKPASDLRQIGIAFLWGLVFGVIPNLFIAGVSW